jgi:hypothetical protein
VESDVQTEERTYYKDLWGNPVTKFRYKADTSIEIRRLLFKFLPSNLYKKIIFGSNSVHKKKKRLNNDRYYFRSDGENAMHSCIYI